MSRIRVLTLHQPWASLIAMGLKKHETRSWKTPYRGLLAIHAGKQPVDEYGCDVWSEVMELAGSLEHDPALLPLGEIVAICTLSDCLKIGEQILSKDVERKNLIAGDWTDGRYAWSLKKVCSLASGIPFKGGQGLRWLDEATSQLVLNSAIPF